MHAVETGLESWVRAFSASDPGEIARLYAEDARLWGTNSTRQDIGYAAIEDYFRGVFARLPTRAVHLGLHAMRIDERAAVVSGQYEFRSTTVEGNPRVLPARFSMCWMVVEGTWLIVDHHSSPLPSGV